MATYRVKKTRNFSTMPNEMLQDKSISHKARGVLCYLLSRPDNWDVRRTDLFTEKDGDSAIRSALNELKKKGYIVWERQFDEHHKLAGYSYSVYDVPQPKCENPHVENPRMEKPQMEKPHVDNQHPTNNQEELNTEKNKKLKKNPPVSPLKKSKRKKPQTTIPEPFVITDGNREWFEREFPAYDCDKTTERWVDEMRSKAIERAEWNAAYRAMIPKTVEWKGVRKPLAKGEIF